MEIREDQSRRKVFSQIVVKKLYPGERNRTELRQDGSDSDSAETPGDSTSQVSSALPPTKIYTATMPPEDYLMPASGSEKQPPISADDNSTPDSEDSTKMMHSKRRRQRKRKENDGQKLAKQERQPSELSKNQKRKLRKKRRKIGDLDKIKTAAHKEEEFTFKNTGKQIEKDLGDLNDGKREAEILDYMTAVWDIYKRKATKCENDVLSLKEDEHQMTELSILLQENRINKDVLTKLIDLKRLAIFNERTKLKQHLEEFEDGAIGITDLTRKLFTYWMDHIAPP